MAYVRRSRVNKQKSAGQFRRNAGKTQKRNIAPPPMRGGIRL